jgi:hypothetical protein
MSRQTLTMPPQPNKPHKWWPLIVVGLALAGFVGALGARYAFRQPQRTWIDGTGLAVPDERAALRRVMWTPPVTLGRAYNTTTHEYEASLSPDGRERYFVRGAAHENPDIYVSYRGAAKWSAPTPVTALNTPHAELGPRVSPDGQWLLFYSDRPGGQGGYDIWIARRGRGGWSAPRNLGKTVNGEFNEVGPTLSADGSRLYFASDRPTSAGDSSQGVADRFDYELYVADGPADGQRKRDAQRLHFDKPVLLEALSTPWDETAPCASPDGVWLYFVSDRVGGLGGYDIYRARLDANGQPADPEDLGSQINTSANDGSPFLSFDGYHMHLASDRAGGLGGYDLYRSQTREVMVQFQPGPPPRFGWHWWALGGALLLMLLFAVYLRDHSLNDLSLLTKCAVISLLVHVLITAMLSVVVVSREIIQAVAPAVAMSSSINLDAAREVEVALQVRQPLTELPVTDPSLRQLAKAQATPLGRPRAPQAAADIPRIAEPAKSRASQAAVPQVQPSQRVPRVEVALPQSIAEQPRFRADQAVPVTEREATPEWQDIEPISEPDPRAVTELAAAPLDMDVPAPPSQPRIQPLARMSEAHRPPVPDVKPLDRETPGPVEVFAQLQPSTHRMEQMPITAHQPDSPQVSQAVADTTRRETAAPQAARSPAIMPVPAARATADSTVTTVTLQPQPADPTAPLALDMPGAVEATMLEIPTAPDLPAEDEPPLAADDQAEGQTLAAQPVGTPSQTKAARIDSMAGVAPDVTVTASLLSEPQARIDAAPKLSGSLMAELPQPTSLPATSDLGPQELAAPKWLFHRGAGQRQRLLDELGGTEKSETAVQRALAFLGRLQESDGHWTQTGDDTKPTGKRRHPMDVAVTGLATLCYLASDHRPTAEGPYRATVAAALDYLVKRQDANGDFRDAKDRYGMYSQAIATLALSEAAAMTGNARYYEAAQRGAKFIIDAQNTETGGWRYKPGDEGDTSVFGWQIMALHSVGEQAGGIPGDVVERSMKWLDAVAAGKHGGLGRYQPKDGPTRPMTAEAAFSRMLLDDDLPPAQRDEVARYLLAEPPGNGAPNYYYWYYASLAMMQVGGEAWPQWNDLTRQHLVQTQRGKGGLEGSWDPKGKWGPRGGRIYTTALATLTLQVYYRYLPMYRR